MKEFILLKKGMGIKNFFQIEFNGKKIAELGKVITLKKLSGSRICIDASGLIYQAVTAMARILKDEAGNVTAHINTCFNKIIQLQQAGIEQIWIFDSPNLNEIKKSENEKRKQQAVKYSRYRLTSSHVKDIQNLLTFMGITWLVAPDNIEAEQYGAFLSSGSIESRFCEYVLSSDSDVFAFGGNMLRTVKQKSPSGKSSKTVYQIFELNDILNHLNINLDKLRELAVVMGTDFNEKTPRVGVKTVVKKIASDSIELTPQQKKVINYYEIDIAQSINFSEFKLNEYSQEKVINFLLDFDFNKERLLTRLKNYKK